MRWDAMGWDAKRREPHHRRLQRLLATHSRAPAAPRAAMRWDARFRRETAPPRRFRALVGCVGMRCDGMRWDGRRGAPSPRTRAAALLPLLALFIECLNGLGQGGEKKQGRCDGGWDAMGWDAMGCDVKRWELHHRRFQRLLATHRRAPAAPRASAAHPRCRATAAPLGLSFIC